MVGKGEPYDDIPWFWSDQYDFNLQYTGFHTEWDELIVRGQHGGAKLRGVLSTGRAGTGGRGSQPGKGPAPLDAADQSPTSGRRGQASGSRRRPARARGHGAPVIPPSWRHG